MSLSTRRLRLSVLLCCVPVLMPLAATAQQDPMLETKEVVVSSTRLPDAPIEARELPAKVSVITSEDIKRTGAKTVQEAVQWSTGIVMYDQVGNNFQQTIDMRGFNGQPVPATAVFVDGQRMNEPDFNVVNFDLIPIESIERIEILPGNAAIYGKNALGGVVNIVTKRGAEKQQITGGVMYGSFHRERYNVTASGPIGKFYYFATMSRETENGYRDFPGSSARTGLCFYCPQAPARISRLFGKVGYRPTESTDLAVSYTYVQDFLQQAGTLPLSLAAFNRRANFTPGDFDDKETNVLRFTGRQELPFGFVLNANAFYRHLAQDLFTVGQTSVSTSYNKTEQKGGTAQLTQESTPLGFRNMLVLGGEYTRNDFGNRLLGSFSGFPFSNLGSANQDSVGLYAQDTFHLTPQLILTGGARYDHDQIGFSDNITPTNDGARGFNRTTARGGVTYLITPATSVYFNYSQGFRVPTFQELFALGPFGSNPNLRPVKTNNYEVGVRQSLGSWAEGAVSLFQIDTRDEILFTCNLCDFSFGDGQNRNVDKTRRRGIEGTLKARFNQYLDGILNYTYTEAQYRTAFNLAATRTVEVGDSLPQVPKHRLSLTANAHPIEGLTISLIGLYVSSQFYLNDENNVQPRVPGYFQLNSRIAYERAVPGGRLTGFLMVNNMLDQKYNTSGIIAANLLTGGGALERFVVPAPGIALDGWFSYQFEIL
ncbi:MAG TPA: TonB-dependent receptor [Nitrospiraceae bacterium]|nr:TonB-dependent receptor [Nitrospiraceae bacterium]